MAWWTRRKAAEPETVQPDMPLIRLEGITKIFKGDADEETRALDDVTVDINRGEYISVSGPSGCGKSTFLSMLALLDAPTRGRYWFNGRRVDQLTPAEKARVRNVDVLAGHDDVRWYARGESGATVSHAGRAAVRQRPDSSGTSDRSGSPETRRDR